MKFEKAVTESNREQNMSLASKRRTSIIKTEKKKVEIASAPTSEDPLTLLLKQAVEDKAKRSGKNEGSNKKDKKKKRIVKSQKTVRVV